MFDLMFIRYKYISLGIMIFGVITVFFLPQDYAIWGLVICILTPFIYACSFIPLILSIIKKHLKIFIFIFAGCFFVVKIFITNLISYAYDIQPEYINNSAVLLAGIYTPILLTFGLSAILFFTFIVVNLVITAFHLFFDAFIQIFALGNSHKKYINQVNRISLKSSMNSIAVIFPLIAAVYVGEILFKSTKYFVYADAEYYSDCMPQTSTKSLNTLYIRKNNSQCYEIHSQLFLIPWKLEYKTIESIKP